MVRAGLSTDAVVTAAFELVDRDGLDALSMRAVAKALGVEAMSLYNHVSHKRELEQLIGDRVWSDIDLAEDEDDWRAAMRRLCTSMRDALLAHPWFFRLPLADGGQNRLVIIEATLTHLQRGGVSPGDAFHGLHVLDGFVYGYAWQADGFRGLDEAPPELASIETGLTEYPHLLLHARQHFLEPPAGDGFMLGLNAILDRLAPNA